MTLTYRKGVEFTGYVMLYHKACNSYTRYYVGPSFLNGYKPDGRTPWEWEDSISCTKCGRPLRVMLGKPLYGKYIKETICSAKCVNATGPSCECACGGKNHGSGWS